MVEKTRDELYRQYEAEVDLYERFRATNIISLLAKWYFDLYIDGRNYE